MRIISLTFEGILNQKHSFDFSDRKTNLIALPKESKECIAEALESVFFGKSEGAEPFKIKIAFAKGGREYEITRIFDGKQDIATVINPETNTLIIDGEGAAKFIHTLINVSKSAFKSLINLDRDNLISSMASEDREHFVATQLSNLEIDGAKTIEAFEALKSEENIIKSNLAISEDVNPTYISSLNADVNEKRALLINAKKDISTLALAIENAKLYLEAKEKHDNVCQRLSELKAKDSDYQELAQLIEDSGKAQLLTKLYIKKVEIEKTLLLETREVDLLKQTISALDEKISSGRVTAKNMEADFVLVDAKIAELNKAMSQLIKLTAENPDSFDLSHIDDYYAEFNEEIKILMAKKQEVDNELEEIENNLFELNIAKEEKTLSANYRKAVINGAVAENKLKVLTNINEHAKANISSVKEDIETQTASLNQVVEGIVNLRSEQKELYTGLIKGNQTREKTLNDLSERKINLYSKYLLTTELYESIAAINIKIAKIDNSILEQRKAIVKLEETKVVAKEFLDGQIIRKEAIEKRLITIKGENHLSNYVKKVSVGDKCPICTSYVIAKNQIIAKPTSMYEKELDDVLDAIHTAERRLLEASENLGNRKCALDIATEYKGALLETIKKTNAVINSHLKKVGASSIAELFKLVNLAIAESNTATMNSDKFLLNQAQLEKLLCSKAYIENILSELNEVQLKNNQKAYNDSFTAIETILIDYNNDRKYYEGETACNELSKVLITEKELENIENMIKENVVKKNVLIEVKESTDARLGILLNKNLSVTVNGVELSLEQVSLKIFASKLALVIAELEKNNEASNIIKIRLSAINKVIRKSELAKEEKDKSLKYREATMLAERNTLDKIISDYDAIFKGLGINSLKDISTKLLHETETVKANTDIAEFIKEVAAMEELKSFIGDEVSKYEPFYTTLADNKRTVDDLQEITEGLSAEIAELSSKQSILKAKSNEKKDLYDTLKLLQERIRKMDGLVSTVFENTILSKDLTVKIMEKADALCHESTKGNYSVKYDKEIMLVNNIKNKTIPLSGMSKYENFLMGSVVGMAFNEIILDLQGCFDFPLFITISEKEDSTEIAKAIKTLNGLQDIILFYSDSDILKEFNKLSL